jgi:hypothetical protein
LPPPEYRVRLVLDEDVPEHIAAGLRHRGLYVATVNELREAILARREGEDGDQASIPDDEVCEEVAREPSVLITLNLRDYADPASVRALAVEHGVSVAMVRAPKAESGAKARAMAIADIVHRNVPRILRLYGDEPSVASLSRRGLRAKEAADILAAAGPEAIQAEPRIAKQRTRKPGRKPEAPGSRRLDFGGSP